MHTIDLVPRLVASTAVLVITARYITNHASMRRLDAVNIVAAALATLSISTLVVMDPFIYTRVGIACAMIGLGLVWATTLQPLKQGIVLTITLVIASALVILVWMPTNPTTELLYGPWFLLSQVLACLAQSAWLYLVLSWRAGTAAAWPLKAAVSLQTASAGFFALGAQNAWGSVFNWDPLESWWLLATLAAGIAYVAWRNGWRLGWIVGIGLGSALATWFLSYPLMQVLHLASLYLVG